MGLLGHQELRNLAEVRRRELTAALVVGGSGHVGQEPRHVFEVSGVRAVEVGPIAQGVHLVDTHIVQTVCSSLEAVEHVDRLTVGDRDDQVRSVGQLVDQRVDDVVDAR